MCSFVSSTDLQNVGLVGDVDAIVSMASSCEKFTHGQRDLAECRTFVALGSVPHSELPSYSVWILFGPGIWVV